MEMVESYTKLGFILRTLDTSWSYFGKTIVQKIVYFLQNILPDAELEYNYQLHYFGPYSVELEKKGN